VCKLKDVHRYSVFQRYFLPGIIFQSVLIGGAYSTGREIVEFGAKFGRYGLWSILWVLLLFSLISGITYEFARVTNSQDYRTFIRHLIGPFWPVFDVLFCTMAVITIAVVGSASGSVVERVLGWPYWLGVFLVIAVAGGVMMGGRQVIERFKTTGSLLLYGGYLLFSYNILSTRWNNVIEALALEPTQSASTAATTGILYVGYNLAGLPAVFFVLGRIEKRSESAWAGIITGVLSTIPFLLTYLCIMAFYPSPEVLNTAVPWLTMLDRSSGPMILTLYGFVIFWTLIETSVGMTHAIIDRISAQLKDLGRNPLTPVQAAMTSTLILSLAAFFSQFGIIALVSKGYGIMAYGFLILFALPLLTIGVWTILQNRT
jgi:uncharacterized membrane protein YkvI